MPELLPHDKLLQGIPHVPVPEAVDQRVQHGHHQRVKHRKDLVSVQDTAGAWSEVQGEDRPMEDGDSGQVRGAGGKGFVLALRGADL